MRVDTGPWEDTVHLIEKTGSAQGVCLHSKWRTSISFHLIALHIAPSVLVMTVCFSVLVHHQTLLLAVIAVKQMHVGVS